MNAYLTIVEAQTYFDERLDTEAWDDATDTDKLKALKMATRSIDALSYVGELVDEDQEHQFPRGDDTTVPDAINEASCDEALSLLDNKDPDMEYENLGMISQGYANVRSTYDRSSVPMHLTAGIVSPSAWRKLKPYLRDGESVDLDRVS